MRTLRGGRARKIGNEAAKNLGPELRSRGKNGILSPRTAGLDGHAPVAWRGRFPVVRRRRGTAASLQDGAVCIQKKPAQPGWPRKLARNCST